MRINPIDPIYRNAHKKKQNDNAYLEWLRSQPCCVCGASPRSQAAHVRLNSRGGIGQKPLFSAVPLCARCHHTQHTQSHESIATSDWWISQADSFLEKWKNNENSV